MPFQRVRRQRRTRSRHPFLLLLGFVVLFLAPVLDTIGNAQVLPIRAQPTATPTAAFEPPLQARSTPTPTPRVTEEPEVPDEIPDDVQANPTAVPVTEPPVDDLAPNPEPATLTLNKGVCDDTGFDPYAAIGLETFQDACFSPDGEFEFTVANGAGFAEAATTSLGTVQFTVPAGNVTITETIPEGFGEPAVFCWSSLFPSPAAEPFIGNGPSWNVADGEQVECWWFNVSEPAPQGHTIRVIKQVCPEGFAIPDDYWTLANGCTDRLDGIGFALITDGGMVEDVTDANGEIEWTDVDLGASGQVQLDEDIPEGYGEPVVWCVNFPQEAADAQDFDFFEVAATDGLIAAIPVPEAPFIFSCTYFNVIDGNGAPGDLIDPASQEGDGGVTVSVIKHRCPLGVPEDTTLDQYLVICAELFDGVSFTLEHDGGSFPGETGEDGQVEWPGVPAGGAEIQEALPEGFKDPIAFCISFDGEQELESGQVAATGGIVPLTIPAAATNVTCWLFNIQDADAGSTVTVQKKSCPAGIAGGSNDVGDYHAACGSEHPGVEFTLEFGGGATSTTATDADGTIEWAGVPTGDFSIQESIPEGFGDPVVFCNFGDVIQGLPFANGPPTLVAAPGGLVASTILEPNVAYLCYYFNILEEDVGSRVLVNKRICPEGADLVLTDDHSINDIITACPEEGDGIEFALDHAEGSSTQAIVDGATWWDGVPNGPITITEEIPAGYGEPVWYCDSNLFDETGALISMYEWEPMIAPGGVLAESLDEQYGEIFACWVFNVPVDDGNSVTVVKWLCPAGFDEETQDPEVHCTEPMGGVTFTLGELEAITGDDQGVAVFEDVPASDDYGLTEILPDGIDHAFVGGCTLNGLPMPIVVALTEPPEILMGVGEGSHWVCTWYNVPVEDEENSVTIFKWTCPEGTGYDEDQAWYAANCVQQHDGVEFKVASDIGIAVMETVGGAVQFDGLPAGTAGIQETIPEGFGAPVVFCATDAGWAVYPAPTGHWEYEFAADGLDQALGCHVYNIPGEPGSLTLFKWTCPPGYDLNAAGADPQADCTEATNGIDFQFGLSGIGEEAVLQTTGDLIDGGVFFDDLDPDTWKATELVPEGIAQVFVLECTGHVMGVLQPYPLQLGNVLEIEIDAGEHLECHWYNVPEPDGGTLTVIKYTCMTETFVSEVDCQIYEDGKTFDLLHWNVGEGVWEAIDTQVTDGVGQIAWIELDAGDYGLDEHDGEWCHLATNPVFGPGDFFSVFDGEETVVNVYNCDGEPGKPGDTPEKYPNTGVPPGARDDDRLQP